MDERENKRVPNFIRNIIAECVRKKITVIYLESKIIIDRIFMIGINGCLTPQGSATLSSFMY